MISRQARTSLGGIARSKYPRTAFAVYRDRACLYSTEHQNNHRLTSLTERPTALFTPNKTVVVPRAAEKSQPQPSLTPSQLRHATREPVVRELVFYISDKSRAKAWDLFSSIRQNSSTQSIGLLTQLTPSEWTAFLEMYSAGYHTSRYSWPRVKKIAEAMRSLGISPSPQDFGLLIERAFKAFEHTEVENIWLWAQERHGLDGHSLLSTDTWNKYIMATCDGYSRFWKGSVARQTAASRSYNDALMLFQEMQRIGVSPNHRTYELLLMYFAKVAGNLDKAQAVISSIWGSDPDHAQLNKDSALYPQVTTLRAIIDAYAVNNKLMDGLALMEDVRASYSINLSGKSAIPLWESLLDWAFYTTRPRGRTPPTLFNHIWDLMTNSYKIVPGDSLWRIRLKKLRANKEIGIMLSSAKTILDSGVSPDLAQSYILHTLKVLRRSNAKPIVIQNILNQWGPLFPDLEHKFGSSDSHSESTISKFHTTFTSSSSTISTCTSTSPPSPSTTDQEQHYKASLIS